MVLYLAIVLGTLDSVLCHSGRYKSKVPQRLVTISLTEPNADGEC